MANGKVITGYSKPIVAKYTYSSNTISYSDTTPLARGVEVQMEVEIGDANFFGVGSIILQQIRIGNEIRLGAGSVLMAKPKDGKLYVGNPARKFEL